MDRNSTSQAAMTASAAKFDETKSTTDSEGNSLLNNMHNMRWDGKAGPRYKQAMEDWRVQFNQLSAHLNEMSQFLRSGGSQYNATEDENTNTAGFFQ